MKTAWILPLILLQGCSVPYEGGYVNSFTGQPVNNSNTGQPYVAYPKDLGMQKMKDGKLCHVIEQSPNFFHADCQPDVASLPSLPPLQPLIQYPQQDEVQTPQPQDTQRPIVIPYPVVEPQKTYKPVPTITPQENYNKTKNQNPVVPPPPVVSAPFVPQVQPVTPPANNDQNSPGLRLPNKNGPVFQ